MSKAGSGQAPDLEVICEGLEFPEGPVALGDGSVLVVEIAAHSLTRVWPDGRLERIVDLGGGPNGAAIGPDGAVYICNNGGTKVIQESGIVRTAGQADDYSGGRIERVDLLTGKASKLYTACAAHDLSGPNDMVFDRHGGFYFTDIGKTRTRDRDRGGIYYAQADGSRIEELVFPLHTPNGIGLSPDEQWLYVAETETARLWKFRVLAPGRLELLPYPASPNGGAIVFGAGGFQRFDSLKVERDGRICVAALWQGGITIVDPLDGSATQVAMADVVTTNLCFGGPDLRTVYLTQRLPTSVGRLAKLTWPRAGLKLNFSERARYPGA